MENWQVAIIQGAFLKCYGLKEAISENNRNAMVELMFQTGIRMEFLDKNIERIKSL